MATAVADLEAVETGKECTIPSADASLEVRPEQESFLSRRLMARLEVMADKRGWTPGEALARALSVAEIVFDANDDPTTKIYVHQQGARYRLTIPR